MKYLLLINLLFISCYPVNKQTVTIKAPLKEISLNKNDLFIVCRGTYSKSFLIAQNFNIKDSNITHCGIGFIRNDVFCIYNVSDIHSNKSCLVIDSLNSFLQSPDVYYLSIWKCKVDAGTLNAIKRKCEDHYRERIDFDYSFTLDNDNTLYCSEFCSRILNAANKEKFHFKPVEVHLDNGFYESILKRKVLIYFPVDFFEEHKEFEKIYEWASSK